MSVQFFNKYTFLFLLCFAFVNPVFAGNKGESQNNEAQCSKNDLRNIKTFNIKARKKVKENEELVATAPDIVTTRDAKEFTEDSDRIKKFFRSEEFQAMEKVYERCDMVIPQPKAKQSFWIPEDQRVHYSGI